VEDLIPRRIIEPPRPSPGLPARSTPAQSEPAGTPKLQEHLFISYAWENCALADWLVRQLTAHGYRVWCDRFEMLGGEPFPKIIDEAIKTRTFRLIALLSRYSLNKPNPRKERTLALSLSRERGIDFMIPLNVDGLKASELPWDYSDLTYIPFENWWTGLEQLLAKLTKLGAPRPITVDDGRAIAAATFLPQRVMVNRPEALRTNCFSFERIPERLYVIEWNQGVPADLDGLKPVWSHYDLPNRRIVAFSLPPQSVQAAAYTEIASVEWRTAGMIEGVNCRNIVSNLLWQAIVRTLVSRGLRRDSDSGAFYFPRGVLPKNKIKFFGRRGRKTWVAVVGEKTFRGKPYRYHLAPDFVIRQDLGADFMAQLRIRVLLTDAKSKRLSTAALIPRRKHLAASWFNRHWLSRVLAIAGFLAKGRKSIVLLDRNDPVVLSATPISGNVPVSIDEAALAALRQQIAASTPGWDEEAEGEDGA